MKRLLALAAAVLLLSTPATAQNTYTINAILPVTGPSAYVGGLMQDALRAFEAYANGTGGLRGVPIHINILDDQSNPQLSVQLANKIKESKPPAIIGPGVVALCAAVAPLVADGPVELCLSPGFYPKPGTMTYASAPSLDGITPAQFRFLRLKGLTRIAVLGSTDASAQAVEAITHATFAMPENATLKNVAYEHFNASDLTVAAQIERIKATDPQALVVYATGAAFLTILRAMHDAALDIPVLTSTANLIPNILASNKTLLPTTLYFNGYVYEDGKALGKGPLLNAADEYQTATKAIGVHASALGALAWDPAKLLLAALRAIGPSATPVQVNEWLQQQTNFPGLMGFYDFKHIQDGHGLAHDDVVIIRWDSKTNDVVPVSKIGGTPL